MWIPTYDHELNRTGVVNTAQIVTVYAELVVSHYPERHHWEVHAITSVSGNVLVSIALSPERFSSHEEAIDHIDELDLED